MKHQSKSNILSYIQKNGSARPHDLIENLGITAAAVHRHLKRMVESGEIERKGTPPKVFYSLLVLPASPHVSLALDGPSTQLMEESFSYVEPTGKIRNGAEAFSIWCQKTNPQQKIQILAAEYLKIRREANSHILDGKIDATLRFQSIFSDCQLDKVFYQDFYSLIQFGKTKMGQMLLHGKQAQDAKLISQLARQAFPVIAKIIAQEEIQAVCWTPHSLPRRIPFLKVVEKTWNLSLPKVEMVKAYSGEIPMAQKSLSKLSERIQNARETMILVPSQIPWKSILLVDDAVGSGATLNELAKKLKQKGVKKVIGFAFVGSYKGFEVIKEV